jgi:exodeoxyribonuclease V alpha subunit
MSGPVSIELTIKNIVFQAAEGTFSVFRGENPEVGTVSVVYKGQAPFAGEQVRLSGSWGEHPRFGRQFQAQSWEAIQPKGTEGLVKMLGSGVLKGVGPAMAQRIVDQFGEDTLKILEKSPERLREVSGIGKKKAEAIVASYGELKDSRELVFFLESHGISGNYAPRIQALYGNTAVTRISNNPYCLAEDVDGIGFRTADALARNLGVDEHGEDRIRAGIHYTLLQGASQGHTCVPDRWLVTLAAKILQVDPLEVEQVFQQLLKDNLLRTEDVGDHVCVYPEYLYRAEEGAARRLLALRDNVNALWKVDYQKIIREWERDERIQLAPEQAEAVKASVDHGVFVLTGGPGTGKTTVIKGILSVMEQAGCKILLAAPTGRAAKRLAESAGKPALTVHRLLEYTPNGEGDSFWGRDEDNPLEADAVIVDEASMMDIVLMYNLLKALPLGCRLILVGDVDQLPSVGPGSVLQDIIRSGTMPIVRLENVFRQAELSPIVRNAHRINQGMMPQWEGENDFSFREFATEEETMHYIVDLYAHLSRTQPQDSLQVLTPMHKNLCGVENLNNLLQARMNPPDPEKQEYRGSFLLLREGDKVMQIRNNYEKNVFNGDIGRIQSIQGAYVTVDFPDRAEGEAVTYEGAEVSDLRLAYAMSVHKSQGSEYGAVIMPLVLSHYILLQRNLFYTAITRAKKQVYLAGSKRALRMAVENDKTRKRYSLLAERLIRYSE